MAIAPLQMLNNGETSLQQLLTRGGNVLAQSLQNSINLGRSLADNQLRQEQDFQREQRSEINLLQRRGELAQQQANTDRSFDQSVYQFDRTADRADESAKFNQTQQLLQNDFALDANQRANRQANTTQQIADLRLSEAERQRKEQEDAKLFTRGVASSNFLDQIDGATPEQRAAVSTAQAAASRESNNVEGFLQGTSNAAKAETEIAREKRLNPILTPAERRMQRGELRTIERQAEADAEKEAKKLISNMDAFPPPTVGYFNAQAASGAEGTEGRKAFDAANAGAGVAAVAQDKDRFSYESQAATARTREDYINASGNSSITAAQKAARGKFWDKVNATTAAPATSTVPSATDWLRNRVKSLR